MSEVLDEVSPSFADWLGQHRRGSLNDELTLALAELAEQVVLEGKGGTLALKLSLSEKGGGVIVSHALKMTPPKVKTEAFYYLDDGALSRRDPNQPQLPGTSDRESSQ